MTVAHAQPGAAGREKLPPPVRRALGEADLRARLPRRLRPVLDELLAGGPCFVAARSLTWVDVGSWFGKRRCWALALSDALVLAAPGPRPRLERLPYALIRESLYNHVTGELVLAPAAGARLRRIRLKPLVAYQLLAQIHGED